MAQLNLPEYGPDQIPADGVEFIQSRAEAITKLHEQAEPWRTGVPIKQWRVKGLASGSTFSFQYLGKNDAGAPAILTASMSAEEAARFNLPGLFSFPNPRAWFAARPASNVMFKWDFLGKQQEEPISNEHLFFKPEADALAVEATNALKNPNLVIIAVEAHDAGGLAGSFDYPLGEDRRVWNISVNGRLNAMKWLFAGRSANGVGAPVTWSVDNAGNLTTTGASQPTGEFEPRSTPIPIRDLLANERPATSGNLMTPGKLVIQRLDMATPQAPATTGSFSEEDRRMLTVIYHQAGGK